MKLVTSDQMRSMDLKTIDEFGLPGRILMENAGKGAADILMEFMHKTSLKNITVFAGGGNNGGDGFVIARYLTQRGFEVKAYLLTEASGLKGDAKTNYELLKQLNVSVSQVTDSKALKSYIQDLSETTLFVDAILGTGINSEVKGLFGDVIDFINTHKAKVFSVDIPSGLDSDTGQVCGKCVKADLTATFGFAKIGHKLYPGRAHTGRLEVIDIGIPPHIVSEVNPGAVFLNKDVVKTYLKSRPCEAHKGTTGHILVIAGSRGKIGAAVMTVKAALRTGAGLVTLAAPESSLSSARGLPVEAMSIAIKEDDGAGIIGPSAVQELLQALTGKTCVAIGPGLGTHPQTIKFVLNFIKQCRLPMIIDADAINSIAGQVDILKNLSVSPILTPHPKEMARLTGKDTADIQANRVNVAVEFSKKQNCHLILKGAGTVITHPDGRHYVNSTGNSGMASGGMGDVLTGIIAGFAAQGLKPAIAAQSGAYLHGKAGDTLSETIGPFGYLASDVADQIPLEIAELIQNHRAS